MMRRSQPGYYNLILADIQILNMNVYEVARYIRSMIESAHVSTMLIAMTVNVFESDAQDTLTAGINGYLTEMDEIAKLMKRLEEVLE